MKQAQTRIHRFLNELAGYIRREDRGALADLRHGFSDATAHRAWPYVARYCDLARERDRVIWLTVAAGTATQKDTGLNVKGNLGTTLRLIAGDGKKPKSVDLKSYDARFRRLLTCSDAEDLCIHLPSVLRTAARKGASVNYERLFWDLCKWHKEEIGVQWASEYWGAPTGMAGGGEDE
jgi:CRISPR type I-E-associated protein CasB/Cse2